MPQQRSHLTRGRLPGLGLGRVLMRTGVARSQPTLERHASTGDVSRRSFDVTRNDQDCAFSTLTHELCVARARTNWQESTLISGQKSAFEPALEAPRGFIGTASSSRVNDCRQRQSVRGRLGVYRAVSKDRHHEGALESSVATS